MEESQAKNKRQMPKEGDIVVLRGTPWYPMYVGEVVPVDKLDDLLSSMLSRWRRRVDVVEQAKSKKRKSAKTSARSSNPPAAAAAVDSNRRPKRRRTELVTYAGQDVDESADPDDSEHSDVDEFEDLPELDAKGYHSESDDVWESLNAANVDDASLIAARKRQLQNKMCVRYYAFTNPDWDDKEKVRKGLANPKDIALWDSACALLEKERTFHRLPEHAVMRWKAVKWVKSKGIRLDSDIGFVDRDGIIQFGPVGKMFTKSKVSKMLTAAVLKAAVADLCEIGEQAMNGSSAAAAINGTAAAMDVDDEKE